MKSHTIILVLLVLAANSVCADENCFNYESQEVSLTGTVVIRTFYGPPNYGDNPESDSKESQAILELDNTICTNNGAELHSEAEINQTEVTLVPTESIDLSKYIKLHVSVTGTLYHAFNGHHRTGILINVKSIQKWSGKNA